MTTTPQANGQPSGAALQAPAGDNNSASAMEAVLGNPSDADFDLSGSATSPASQQAPASGQQQQQPQNATPNADGTPPTSAPDPVADLQRRLAEAEGRANAFRTVATAQPQPAQPAAPTPPPGPVFNFSPESIPQTLRNLILSEDPNERLAGLMMAISAAANAQESHFRQTVQNEYQPQFQQYVQQYYGTVQGQNEMRQQFYSSRQHLNTTEGRALAQIAALAVAQEYQAAGKPVAWSPDFMKDLDTKIYTLAPGLKPAEGGTTPPLTPTPPLRQPGSQIRAQPTARPSTPGQMTLSDHMAMIAEVTPLN